MSRYISGLRLDSLPRDSYLSHIGALTYLATLPALTFTQPVTFFVGENGSGKSTLLEAIAINAGFNPEGGSRDFSFSTKNTHSELHKHITTFKKNTPNDGFFLRAESFYNLATFLDENSPLTRYGGVSFHEQSHGESFLNLITHRCEGTGLYLLDEPEAALSPTRQLGLLCAIDELVSCDSQFIIATHSPILLAYPKATILQFSEESIEKIDYRDTEHYRVTKLMLDDPEHTLHHLLHHDDD